jgi:hypothetical protein
MKFTQILATLASVSAYDWSNYNSTLANLYRNAWDDQLPCDQVREETQNWEAYTRQAW